MEGTTVSNPRGKKGKRGRRSRLEELKCFSEVEELICSGFPATAIAKYIQKDQQECTDITYRSLEEYVRRYRNNLIDNGVMVQYLLPKAFEKVKNQFSDRLQELRRTEARYLVMERRFYDLLLKERVDGQTIPYLDRIHKSMLDLERFMHDVKMDLGLAGSRDLGTLTVSAERAEYIKHKYGEGAAKAFRDPVSRGRVLAALGAAKRAGKLRNKDGTPLELDECMDLSEDEKGQIINMKPEKNENNQTEYKPSHVLEDGEDIMSQIDRMEEEGNFEESQEEERPELKPEPRPKPKIRDEEIIDIKVEPPKKQHLPNNLPPPMMTPGVAGKNIWQSRLRKKEKNDSGEIIKNQEEGEKNE